MGCEHEQCHDTPLAIMSVEEEQWADELSQLLAADVQRVWKSKSMPLRLSSELTRAYGKRFATAIQEGYGVNLQEFDYTTPDGEMIKNLIENVYQFSAAKNYTQLKQLTRALVDETGKLRTFSQFRQEAFKITDTISKQWLKTEYDTAIGSAQMASKWVAIQKNKRTLPLLQFDAVIDSRTSETCRPLDGVTKPVDDPFWSIYYPPNHFRCRSSVKQLAGGVITKDHEITHPDKGIPEMFKTNLAKSGMVFPKGHPYWEGITEAVLSDASSSLQKDIHEWAKQNISGKQYEVEQVGKVGISNNSIKEILHKPHEFRNSRNFLLYNVEEVLKRAQLIQISPDAKNNPFIKQWHYLKFSLNGKPSYINIREMQSGEKTIYAITDSIK